MKSHADLELSNKLHELSGWKGDLKKTKLLVTGERKLRHYQYSAGYLLRKLEQETPTLRYCTKYKDRKNVWVAEYGSLTKFIQGVGETPENALCKLAIKLFEEGILTKEEAREE